MPMINHRITARQAERLEAARPRLLVPNTTPGSSSAAEMGQLSRSALIRLGIEMVLHALEEGESVVDYLPDDAGEWDRRRMGDSLRHGALQVDAHGDPVAWGPLASEAIYKDLLGADEFDLVTLDQEDEEGVALARDATLIAPDTDVWIRGLVFTGGDPDARPVHAFGVVQEVGQTRVGGERQAVVLVGDEEQPVTYDPRDLVPAYYSPEWGQRAVEVSDG